MKYIHTPHILVLLTLSRIVVSPLVLAPLLVWAGITDSALLWCSALVLVLALCATNIVQWYLAYTYQLESSCSALLAPVGDLFLLLSMFVGLLSISCIAWGWVLLFLCRDFFVMSIRLAAEQKNVHMPILSLARIQKVVLAIALVLIIMQQWASLYHGGLAAWLADISFALLLIAGFLSVVTAFFYAHQLFIALHRDGASTS